MNAAGEFPVHALAIRSYRPRRSSSARLSSTIVSLLIAHSSVCDHAATLRRVCQVPCSSSECNDRGHRSVNLTRTVPLVLVHQITQRGRFRHTVVNVLDQTWIPVERHRLVHDRGIQSIGSRGHALSVSRVPLHHVLMGSFPLFKLRPPAPRISSQLDHVPLLECRRDHGRNLIAGHSPPLIVGRGFPSRDHEHMTVQRATDKGRRVSRCRTVETETHFRAGFRLSALRIGTLLEHSPRDPTVRAADPLPETIPAKRFLTRSLESRSNRILEQKVTQRRVANLPALTIINRVGLRCGVLDQRERFIVRVVSPVLDQPPHDRIDVIRRGRDSQGQRLSPFTGCEGHSIPHRLSHHVQLIHDRQRRIETLQRGRLSRERHEHRVSRRHIEPIAEYLHLLRQSLVKLDHTPGRIEHDPRLPFIRCDDEHLSTLHAVSQQRVHAQHSSQPRLSITTRHGHDTLPGPLASRREHALNDLVLLPPAHLERITSTSTLRHAQILTRELVDPSIVFLLRKHRQIKWILRRGGLRPHLHSRHDYHISLRIGTHIHAFTNTLT